MKEKEKAKSKRQNHDSKSKTNLRARCYYFSVEVIKFIESETTSRVYHSIIDQLIRSSTSVGANIIEAKSASSKKDFIKYYEIALKSGNETKYWLALLRDAMKIDRDKIAPFLQEVSEITNIIAASILTMKNRR